MELILIIAPYYTSQKLIEKFLKTLREHPTIIANELDTMVFIIKDEDIKEWKLLSNKFNEDLFEKYHKQIKELEKNG